jgi:glycosyltransferase involved in cell wall biosynthesis
MNPRLAYLMPEYPGQTHTFIRREIDAMRAMGAEVVLFSTRRPPSRIVIHEWARRATEETTYLHPLPSGGLWTALRELLRAGPRGWARVAAAILGADVPSLKQRLRLIPLVVFGALLAGFMRQKGLGHVHVHMCGDVANVALFAHLLSGVGYSLVMHNSLSEFGPNQREKWRHAAFGVTISNTHLKEAMDQLGDAAPARFAVAPMGVETGNYRRDEPYVPWDGQGPARIFCCGRLNPQKNHPDLVRALAVLRGQGFRLRLRIAGGDDTPDQRYRAELEDVVAQTGMTDAVELLGPKDEAAVRREYSDAHVYAMASRHEGVPVSVMEAMAMGLPAAVTEVGGVRELIEDGQDGLLCPPGDPTALAGAIRRILDDSDFANRLSRAARAKIERDFDSSRSARTVWRMLGWEAAGEKA